MPAFVLAVQIFTPYTDGLAASVLSVAFALTTLLTPVLVTDVLLLVAAVSHLLL